MKIVTLVLAVMFSLVCVSPLAADDAAPDSTSTISPAQQKAEIDAAKALVARIATVKKFEDFGPCLTNRSAGMLAMVTGGITVAFHQTPDEMNAEAKELGEDLQHGTSSTPSRPKQHGKTAAQTRFDAILKRYGCSDSSSDKDTQAALDLHGRALLSDVAAFLASLPKSQTESGSFSFKHTQGQETDQGKTTVTVSVQASGMAESDLDNPYRLAPEDLSYKVVTATQVDIIDSRHADYKESARLEDGEWRLDIGGIDSLSQLASPSATHAPMSPDIVLYHIPIFDAAMNGDTERVKELYAADPTVVNQKDPRDGKRPLAVAAFCDRRDVASLLISEGAQVNAQDEVGTTALMQAVGSRHADIVQLLLAHGARTGFKDNGGQTALSMAEAWHDAEIEHLLRAAGATR
jgi:hypothetical protein